MSHFLGIDVGWSESSATTGLCLISVDGNSLRWQCLNTFTDQERRIRDLKNLIPRGSTLLGAGIDGPLVPSLHRVNRYRSPEALLSRGLFQHRGKPGQTNSGNGQKLHSNATSLANLVIELQGQGHITVAHAAHPDAIDNTRVVEAFPTAFLSVLLADSDFTTDAGGNTSDDYWEVGVRQGYLNRLLDSLFRQARRSQLLQDLTDHDHRAAFVCALTALCVEQNQYVAVGSSYDGDIMLPSAAHWGLGADGQRWAETALRTNLPKVKSNKRFPHHEGARVRCGGEVWLT